MNLLRFILFLIAITGCKTTANSVLNVFNGDPAPDWQITIPKIGPCTGIYLPSLSNPTKSRLIVTAAHCSIESGGRYFEDQNQKIEQLIFAPATSSHSKPDLLAVALTSCTSIDKQVSIGQLKPADLRSKEVQTFGFGIDETEFQDGAMEINSRRPLKFAKMKIQQTRAVKGKFEFSGATIFFASDKFQSLCVGDSGGPSLLVGDSKNIFVGVTSRNVFTDFIDVMCLDTQAPSSSVNNFFGDAFFKTVSKFTNIEYEKLSREKFRTSLSQAKEVCEILSSNIDQIDHRKFEMFADFSLRNVINDSFKNAGISQTVDSQISAKLVEALINYYKRLQNQFGQKKWRLPEAKELKTILDQSRAYFGQGLIPEDYAVWVEDTASNSTNPGEIQTMQALFVQSGKIKTGKGKLFHFPNSCFRSFENTVQPIDEHYEWLQQLLEKYDCN